MTEGLFEVHKQEDSVLSESNPVSTATARFGRDFNRIPICPPAPQTIQTKLTVSQPDDKHEQEADRVNILLELLMADPKDSIGCNPEF